jgi:hypothetical protein
MIVVGSEKNFAALRPRLFGGSVSSKAAGEVSAAIQAANPHADLKKLEPGTVLVVPDDLPHVAVRGDLSLDKGAKSAAAGVLEAGDAALADLTADAQARARDVAAERKAQTRTLSGKQVTAAAAKDKAIAASLEQARRALAAADAAAKARAAALAEAQEEWSKELAALRKALPS